MLDDHQGRLCRESPGGFDGLRALFVNTSLKRDGLRAVMQPSKNLEHRA